MWSSEFSIGVKLIDDEHREIIEVIDELVVSNNPAFVAEVLMRYIDQHFADEERIMRNIGYVHYEYHRDLHVQFASRVMGMIRRVDEPGMVDEIARFASAWISDHIASEDSLLAAAIKEFTDSVFDGISIDPKYIRGS